MILRLSRFCLLALLCLSLPLAATSAKAATHANILVDAETGEVLASMNPDAITYPASLTKMMTLYLTFEALHSGRLSWDQRLVISKNANDKEPYKFAIGAGNTISVREAVMGMVVLSANDAATAVAETLAGSEAAFGVVMTVKAHKLGMNDTVFTNPSGLPDPAQVTTATDMARLGLALIRDFPEEYKLFASRGMTFRGMKLRGHNPFLVRYPGGDGIKTGYTKAAGYNIVTSATNGERRLVGVVLGASSNDARNTEIIGLFEKHLGPVPVKASQTSIKIQGQTP
ncbi:D-alanyl-D-alanine carboxypeptidase family protein [Rhizobium sp. AG855]|uniref:D-alanyl-D-alanine carboxypeptidase family protein n=1 Tax=Rhizobium sp. AG855 TaxID=2183898 RepID=UPI000E769EB2|nr:D-alanyl-D-alanine carboxypeptidase family protein [Rhizobium sp. AG855]RKE84501.1 D-alanyl-D-alanine carboxypeptidase (penicillin-binding protein 5/6) [Rhizobium sp. AG855]